MNINFEKIPAVIFDWLETTPYQSLSDTQKKLIAGYFSEEEYNEMHDARMLARNIFETTANHSGSENKQRLLEHFDKHNNNDKTTGSTQKLLFWQAAAVLLMLLSGGLFYNFMDLKKTLNSNPVASVDTVYVTKEINSAPLVVYDTVYKYVRSSNVVTSANSPDEFIPESEDLDPLSDDIYPQAIDLENFNTRPRGSSMKDDSLLKKFSFVSM